MATSTTNSVRKPTKRQMFEGLLNVPGLTEAQVDFIKHEIDLLNKKNSGEKKPTAVQIANEAIKQGILSCMEDNRIYTVSEMIKEFPCCAGLSNPKVSALLTQLKDAGLVKRTEEKRRAYFQKVLEVD